ncbi:MAG: hypothetical protein ACT4TC_15550 [Myxococcaceae bacterium]
MHRRWQAISACVTLVVAFNSGVSLAQPCPVGKSSVDGAEHQYRFKVKPVQL